MFTTRFFLLCCCSLFLGSCVQDTPFPRSSGNVTDTFDSHRFASKIGTDFESMGPEIGALDLPRRIRHIPTGIVLILIDPGDFLMGTPLTEKHRDRDEAQHHVTISAPYYLGETEVTVGQWVHFMGRGTKELPANEELPMSGVSWHHAHEFLHLLNQASDGRWRLPTEAEWEYACRAGTTTPFSFGEDITPEHANYNGQRPYLGKERGLDRNTPVPVRSLPLNPWGLYEMHGNLWEWCEDLYLYNPDRDPLPRDPTGKSRVMRGGGFPSRGEQLRCGYRDGYPPNSSGEKYGFRLAKTVTP